MVSGACWSWDGVSVHLSLAFSPLPSQHPYKGIPMTPLQTEQRRSPWERRRAWRSLTGKGAPTPPKQWAGVPRRWAVDFTVYFTLVWGWSESHSGLNSAGSAHGRYKQRAQRTLPTPGQGALRPWGSQIWVPIPEASWTTSGSFTQDHRPLDDKLRGRHCISGSAPSPSLTVSLPVSMRSWGGQCAGG